jgi:hypothetical protein
MRLTRLPQAAARAQPSGGHRLVSFAYTQDPVVPLDEILPREPFGALPSAMLGTGRAGFGVARLGGGGGQVETEWIGILLAQKVGHIDGGTTALAELAPFEVEVFMG